jgi:Xaa-Pro dipeptidase
MKNLAGNYKSHIETKLSNARTILERSGLDSMVIHSGKLKYMFQDDMTYPFKANPLFLEWVPIINNPNCWIVINKNDKPKLVFFQPVDFWHSVPADPTEYWVDEFDFVKLANADEVNTVLPKEKSKSVYLGEYIEDAKSLGFEKINESDVMDYLHYHRAYKTDYQMDCLREANRVGVIGHKAAKAAFYGGASEFEIHLEYLKAISHTQEELPYGLIMGMNKNAAVLHYHDFDRTKFAEKDTHSFLIDAGARFNGFASDITRTYAYKENEFSDLIKRMTTDQIELVNALKLGESYAHSHYKSLEAIAKVLIDFDLVRVSQEELLAKDLVKPFYPHGLGHHLGLQVHDLGANLENDKGIVAQKSDKYPTLRATRVLEPRMVYTVEPGLYFIDSLLDEVRNSDNSKAFNWSRIEDFKKFGGIRIEDNIILHEDRNENMTRELGLE